MMKIAIQGELGSFSHEAAEAMLPRAKVVPCARSLEVFDRVKRGTVDGAVIPIENSLAGSVAEHFDLLLVRDVHIVREFRLRIVHNVIALPGTKLGDIRRVFSHPVALDQCRDLFAKNLKLEPVPFYDTAGSVKHVVAEGLRDAAGIASRRAAEVYAGKILKAGVEDDKKNFTRFFLIRRGKAQTARRDGNEEANKTSLAFSVKNIPGALFKALSVFALRDISLSKIESRPMRGRPWEYVFFVDLLRGDDEDSRNALRHLSEVCELVKVLGIYPGA
ncbi:MAG TPA: prephenate dehydratase [Terriglobales bacterium]|nr:prephenate dehydratase [Terriglobales bacterium]